MAKKPKEARAKPEFSKKLLYADYAIFVVLLLAFLHFTAVGYATADFAVVLGAWAVQLGVSQAAYYWKAKNENRVKVPIAVIESLPPRVRKELDLTQVVVAIIQSE